MLAGNWNTPSLAKADEELFLPRAKAPRGEIKRGSWLPLTVRSPRAFGAVPLAKGDKTEGRRESTGLVEFGNLVVRNGNS